MSEYKTTYCLLLQCGLTAIILNLIVFIIVVLNIIWLIAHCLLCILEGLPPLCKLVLCSFNSATVILQAWMSICLVMLFLLSGKTLLLTSDSLYFLMQALFSGICLVLCCDVLLDVDDHL
jgi:hypothetical protein